MLSIWHQFVDYFKTGLTTIADAFAFLGGHRWAAAIICVTIIVRTLLLPLAVKQIRGMRDQQRLAPEVQRLKQKYKSDRAKFQQEMMQLYQREGVNPYAACLPMVAQMPVFIAMYQALQSLAKGGHAMPFLGLGSLTAPARASIAGWLLIVLMTLAQLFTTLQLNPGQTDQQKRLQLMMPLIFVFMFMGFPAALVLYWATQSIYQLVQQIIMTRDMRKEAGGWRSLIPFLQKPKGKPGQRPKPQQQMAPKPEKPQVSASPAVAVASGAGPIDVLANRRQLEEKRQRRRRNKKRRKR